MKLYHGTYLGRLIEIINDKFLDNNWIVIEENIKSYYLKVIAFY